MSDGKQIYEIETHTYETNKEWIVDEAYRKFEIVFVF